MAVREELYEALEPSLRALHITRRQFLRLIGAGAAGAILTACPPIIQAILDLIKNRPVRKDISTLTASDPIVTTYEQAITLMKALPSTDRRNWVNQANIHRDSCPHGNWLFLPWHRAYLYRFEEIIRQLTGNNTWALPYWNWTKNPQIPPMFFNTASPLYNPTRTATSASTASSGAVGTTVIEGAGIMGQTNFLLFASGSIAATAGQRTFSAYHPLEGTPHNYIHGFVGGDMGTISRSPQDPIFWLHHNMIEHIWVDWNMKRGRSNTADSAWTGRRFTEFCDRAGNAVNFSVFDMILYPLFTYRFDDLP